VNGGGSFDARRLTTARWAAGLTKRDLADKVGVSPASVTQYEAGRTVPPGTTLASLCLACGVPQGYLLSPPSRRRPDLGARSFFRSLRSTSQRDRDRADAQAEHVFDLVDVLDREVRLPPVDVPEIALRVGSRGEIEAAAAAVREAWQVPAGPIAHVVRLLEAHGVVVARLPSWTRTMDAFSRRFAERPVVMLWTEKDDKARSRFDAAHELGHLCLHSDAEPLSQEQERQANMFASAFLMPAEEIKSDLIHRAPTARDWPDILARRARWGVSAKALLYRSRELGALSEAGFRRAMQNYARQGMAARDGSALGEPETPVMLSRGLAALGISTTELADLALLPLAQVEAALGPPAADASSKVVALG
jgi:Zn-dependent peptidase ImmA (M78 family)/transcriptional regulator with XRE-family HTH domain